MAAERGTMRASWRLMRRDSAGDLCEVCCCCCSRVEEGGRDVYTDELAVSIDYVYTVKY